MTEPLAVQVRRTPDRPEQPLPEYASIGASGLDLRAALSEPMMLRPGSIQRIPTGLELAIPPGYEGQIRARSGLALRGLLVVNGPGTIDADYRGEVQVILGNLGSELVPIVPGMRIAQLVISRVERVQLRVVTELDGTARGAGGFGHTGLG